MAGRGLSRRSWLWYTSPMQPQEGRRFALRLARTARRRRRQLAALTPLLQPQDEVVVQHVPSAGYALPVALCSPPDAWLPLPLLAEADEERAFFEVARALSPTGCAWEWRSGQWPARSPESAVWESGRRLYGPGLDKAAPPADL